MVYESSYESGRKPFRPDLTRGSWAAPSDFIYAAMGLAFKTDIITVTWFGFFQMGLGAIIPYLICLGLYVVPLFVIQSFMGQFSNSGFISSFRISPLFKGMGFVSLGLNLAILTYYSIFAAIPMIFLFNSFRPTLPWSCEGFKEWSHTLQERSHLNICNVTYLQEIKAKENNETDTNSTIDIYYTNHQVPSVLYFASHFEGENFMLTDETEFSISWALIACNLLVWAILGGLFYKFFNTEKIGKILRYMVLTTISLLLICLVRFIFLPGALNKIDEFFMPHPHHIMEGIASVPIFVLSAFGAGWGTIVSLASFNKFKSNIMQYSWIICLGQMLVFMLFALTAFLVDSHFEELTDGTLYIYVEHHLMLYLSTGSAIANLPLPNLWSIIFYTMLTMAAVIIMITQIYSILVSVFDEFEYLRVRKMEVTLSMIGGLALISLYFCSSHGVVFFTGLAMDSLFTQTGINLLLLLVVLWIYGRERFQRDIDFMLGQRFSTWKVNMLRFVSSICLLFILIISFVISIYEHMFSSVVVHIMAALFIVLPWLFIPGYAVFNMLQTSGSFKMRFKRCCRPTDWYPVETEDRQRYEEAMNNMDITHQLNEVGEEVL